MADGGTMHHTFASRLLELRLAAGLSQAYLARGLMSTSHLSRLETGARRPSPQTIAALAERLGVDPESLAGPEAPVGRHRLPCIEELGERLLRAREYAMAEDLASRVIHAAGDAGRRARALRIRAMARAGQGRLVAATRDLEHALRLAREHGHVDVAVVAALHLRDLRERQLAAAS